MNIFSSGVIILAGIIALSTNAFAESWTNEQRKVICIDASKQIQASMTRESPRQFRSIEACTLGSDGIPIMHYRIDYKPQPYGDKGRLLSEIFGANEAALQINCIHLSDQIDIFNVRTSFYYENRFIISTNLSKARCNDLKSLGRIPIDGKPRLTEESLEIIKKISQVEEAGVDFMLNLLANSVKDKVGSAINKDLMMVYAKSEKEKLSYGYRLINAVKNQILPGGMKIFVEQKVRETCELGLFKMLIGLYGVQVAYEYLDKNNELFAKILVNSESCREIW